MKFSNNIITIEVAEHGAEMVSLTKDGREYLWTGGERFWNRHAPILFPAVGKPYNNEIHVDGVAYPMKQHGFARDSEFTVLPSNTGLRLRMQESELSRSYPYHLGLEVCYRLEGSIVETTWTVENLDNKIAYFQIGAHPGFLLPDFEEGKILNGYIRFYDNQGKLVAPAITSFLDDGNRVPPDKKLLVPKEMPIMPRTFIKDAHIFEGGQVAKAELWDRHGQPVLNVSCPQAEAFGVWAPSKEESCPFVCLEPWCGICDPKGFTDDISKRQYIHRLTPGETYTFTYIIEIY